MSDGGLPPAGYYPDPDDPSVQRWWDGHRWATPATRGDTGPSALPSQAPTRALPTRTNPLAVWSLVLGLLWIGFLGSITAVVLGHIATARIEAAGGAERGRGLAIAGMIVGYVGVGMLAVLLLAFVAGG